MVSDSEVRPRGKHRTFTAEAKARILAEYEAAATPLERAALMRREGIYSSLLSNWRKQLAAHSAPKRGRPANPQAADLARLRKDNDRLRHRLEKAERTIEALGKAHALLQMIAGESNADDERSKPSRTSSP
jgi:transposase